MGCNTIDLTIEGALADPVIAAAMRADNVDPHGFETLLRTTARDLDGAHGASARLLAIFAMRAKAIVGGAKPRW